MTLNNIYGLMSSLLKTKTITGLEPQNVFGEYEPIIKFVLSLKTYNQRS